MKCLFVGVVVMVMVCAWVGAQETPMNAPVKPWAWAPQMQFGQYSLTWTTNPLPNNPPGSGPYWPYHHSGSTRYGTATCVTAFVATLYLPDYDHGAFVVPSGCDPLGRLSWFLPDAVLTPASLLGVGFFVGPGWLPRVHGYNWIHGLNMVVPAVPALVGQKFYVEGMWWNGAAVPPVGVPCGTISTPLLGGGGFPLVVTIIP